MASIADTRTAHHDTAQSSYPLRQRETKNSLPRAIWRTCFFVKIQRVIEKHDLYYHPQRIHRQKARRRHNQARRRITELKRQGREGFLIALDGITMLRAGMRRYILTAIDVYSKIAFARMYQTKHSKHAADFLRRMHYLLEGKMENIQTDNGSEFGCSPSFLRASNASF